MEKIFFFSVLVASIALAAWCLRDMKIQVRVIHEHIRRTESEQGEFSEPESTDRRARMPRFLVKPWNERRARANKQERALPK